MNQAALFLILTLFNLLGVVGGLAMMLHEKIERPAWLRYAGVLVILTFAAAMMRGQSPVLDMVSVLIASVATWLTFRFVRTINMRTRQRQLLGRSVPHT